MERRARKLSEFTCKRALEDTTLPRYVYCRKKKKKKKNKNQIAIFNFARHIRNIALYSDLIHSFDWKSAVEHDGGV